MDNSNEIKSPINGSALVPDPSTGLLYSEADGLYYANGVNGIQALQSPINGSALVPDPSTGLLYSEADGFYYTNGVNGIQVLKEDVNTEVHKSK